MNERTRWDEDLNVGSDVIDNQHRVLFDLIQDLHNSIKVGVNKKVVDTLFGVLRDYAFQHFQTEEEYFIKHAEHTKHCLEHYALIKRLNVFILDFRNNRIKNNIATATFLEDWLFEHIKRFDKPFLSDRSVHLPVEAPAEIDEFDVEKRRLHKRIPHNEVVDGDISALVYNATKLRNSKAKIVNMSPGGLQLSSLGDHEIDDLLIVSCSIGKIFKMDEKVKVKAAQERICSVQFISPSPQTIDFFTKLYGSVHLNRAKLD
jgi:hemerythrin-like metal-binding protein